MKSGWYCARGTATTIAVLVVLGLFNTRGFAAQTEFPYASELLLEAAPMRGAKRVPIIEVDPSGQASIDLWCASVQAQFVIAGDTLTIVPGEKSDQACAPERVQADADLLAALQEITGWRRRDDLLVLDGPRPLRFRLSTH
jgi:heat shock protein HslJ